MARDTKKMTLNIPGYRIVKKIGQGGMGAVFLAEQKSMARTVALKILPKSLAEKETFKERFFQEARSAGRLNHPNIVTAIDANEANGICYLAMEYVEGISVLAKIRQEKIIAEKEALSIGVQIATALAHAWKNNLIHRDVKPENILYTPAGVAKLCDLGIAKMDTGDASLTQTGKAIGTPKYISPEQARGSGELDFRADIYSLGASLYHMLVGEPPFDGNSSPAIMLKHIKEPLPPLRERNPKISEGTAAVVEKMLEKNPNNRYDSAESLLTDLEMVEKGERPPLAQPKRRKNVQSARSTNRNTAAPTIEIPVKPLIGGGIAILVAVTIIFFWGFSTSPRPATSSTNPLRATTKSYLPSNDNTELKRKYALALEYMKSWRSYPDAKREFSLILKKWPREMKYVTPSKANLRTINTWERNQHSMADFKKADRWNRKKVTKISELKKKKAGYDAVAKKWSGTNGKKYAIKASKKLLATIKAKEKASWENAARRGLKNLQKRRLRPSPETYLKKLSVLQKRFKWASNHGEIAKEIKKTRDYISRKKREKEQAQAKIKNRRATIKKVKKYFQGKDWVMIDKSLTAIIKSEHPSELQSLKPDLENLGAQGGRAKTRAKALVALSHIDKEEAVRVAAKQLTDRNETVRLGAIKILVNSKNKPEDVIKTLSRIKRKDPSRLVKDAAAAALKKTVTSSLSTTHHW